VDPVVPVTGRDQVGDRYAVFVALGPRPVAASVGVRQRVAEGGDGGHAAAGMTIGKTLSVGEVEEPEISGGYHRLLDRAAAVVVAGVGPSSVVRDGHRAIGVQCDHTVPRGAHSASSAA